MALLGQYWVSHPAVSRFLPWLQMPVLCKPLLKLLPHSAATPAEFGQVLLAPLVDLHVQVDAAVWQLLTYTGTRLAVCGQICN